MTPVYILLAAILIALIYLIFRSTHNQSSEITDELSTKLNELFPSVLKNANEQLISMANQKLIAEKQEISSDLHNKKAAIEDLVKRVLEELNKNQNKLEIAEKDRVGSFNGLKEAIENNRKITEQLSVTAENLKKVLSNNQMRGAFGEKVAEDLLKMSGFVIGTDYTKQESSGESRPDFTIYLPDKTKINIDSKFPYSNIVKMSETDDSNQKTTYRKLFEQDIKKKVQEVSNRDYINPENNTVDFVILFIPNEMIFSFIYETFPEIWQEALTKKVILAGPFSFTAILRMVHQAYDNFRYQKNIQNIITEIKIFEKEFAKYNEEFEKLGEKINAVSKVYDSVNTTRTRQLLRTVDKIKIDSPPPSLT